MAGKAISMAGALESQAEIILSQTEKDGIQHGSNSLPYGHYCEWSTASTDSTDSGYYFLETIFCLFEP